MSTPGKTPRRDRRHVRHEETRAEILATAWRLAARDGVGGLRLRDLAREVGVQPQSLYSYVDSKNALLDAMFAESVRELLDRLDTVPDGSPESRLRAGTELFVRACAAQPERFLLVFQRPVPDFVPSEASMGLAGELLARFTRALRDAGVQDPAVVDLFTASVTGLVSQQVSNQPGGDRWISQLDRLVTALLHA